MSVKYKAGAITVTTDATEINPVFDIISISVISDEGAVLLRVYNSEGWGDWIKVPKDVSFDDRIACSKFQIKSVTGSVAVNYYSKGE